MLFIGGILKSVFGRKVTKSQLRARAAMNQVMKLRARYDAAGNSPELSEHWMQADDLSARAANSLPVRRIIRRRARYETANNSYAAGMLLTMANDIVGKGPRLRMRIKNKADARKIQQEFAAWAREVRLPQILRTMVITKVRDGEVFLKFRNNPKHQTPCWLDLEVLEGDQVTTPALVPTKDHIDGIKFDQWGNPEFYDVLDQHPGDDIPHISYQPTQVHATNMLHWFRVDRPGQLRGISEITPALPLYAMLRRYTLAVVTAAETAADHAAVLQAGSTAGQDDADDLEPLEEIGYTRGLLTAVPFGWQLMQLKAEQPTTTYAQFKAEILTEIARCLSMPYNVACGNSSGYNYSSGRLDHQVYFKSIGITQEELESIVLDFIFRAWYTEASLRKAADGTPLVPQIDLAYRPWTWAWDPAEDIDPSKTSAARMVDLQIGATSFQQIFDDDGLDWETVQADQAEALGLELPEYRKLLCQKLFGSALAADPNAPQPGLAARRQRKRSLTARARQLFGRGSRA